MRRWKPILVAAAFGAAIGLVSGSRKDLLNRILPGAGDRWNAMDPALKEHRPLLIAAIVGVVLFSLYWEIAARNSAAAKSREAQSSRGLHVFLVNAALLLELIPVRGLGRFLPVSPAWMSAGLALEAAGIALAVSARRHLGRNWSGAIAIKVEHQLIRSGPYRTLRHPIYTGLLAIYLGIAVVTGEWLALIGLAVAVLAYWRKIRLEEAVLDAAFGPDYSRYRKDTWALIPGLF